MLFALSVVTAGLGVYYRDSCTIPYGCLGQSGLLLYLNCGETLCPVNHTAVDLRQCQLNTGPSNGSDTWLDKGCELLGGGCTRRFAKSVQDKPWCVPVALDQNGTYAPAVRIGTTKCRIQCNQDYGILDAKGNMSCACPSSPPPAWMACHSNHTEVEVGDMSSCFCQSLMPCNASSCPCITHQGAMARNMDYETGRLDVRAVYPFDDLFPVVPCQTESNDNRTQCPVHWQRKLFGGYSLVALANGYRFLRPTARLFYQPTRLAVSALHENRCACVENCFSTFPTILCILPAWSDKPVQCVASSYLDTIRDLHQVTLSVKWQDRQMGVIKTSNGTRWNCSTNSRDQCEIVSGVPLESAPKCVCLLPCSPPTCNCVSGGFRLFEHFDVTTEQEGLCSLSWKAPPMYGR